MFPTAWKGEFQFSAAKYAQRSPLPSLYENPHAPLFSSKEILGLCSPNSSRPHFTHTICNFAATILVF